MWRYSVTALRLRTVYGFVTVRYMKNCPRCKQEHEKETKYCPGCIEKIASYRRNKQALQSAWAVTHCSVCNKEIELLHPTPDGPMCFGRPGRCYEEWLGREYKKGIAEMKARLLNQERRRK